MAGKDSVSPCDFAYDTVCEIDKNSKYIEECKNACATIEQIRHLLFRLQNNEAIRDLDLSLSMYEDEKMLSDVSRKLSRVVAEVEVKNMGLLWSLKSLAHNPSKRGRPKKIKEVA